MVFYGFISIHRTDGLNYLEKGVGFFHSGKKIIVTVVIRFLKLFYKKFWTSQRIIIKSIAIVTYFLRLKISLLALFKSVLILYNKYIFVDGPDGFHELSL